jgi:16S rRNA C967 or C1407 C5-methylase (RsmB/RsmF family)
VRIQGKLLRQARQLADRRTRIIYATCSLEGEENEEQVGAFCRDSPDWRLDKQVFTTPDEDRDGGFAAVLLQV